MPPKPFIVIQGLVAAALLATLGAMGAWELVLATLVVIGGMGGALRIGYRRQLHGQTAGREQMRLELDRVVDKTWACVVFLPAALLIIGWMGGWGPIRIPILGEAFISAAAVPASIIFLSSLIDWYWITPRLFGIVRPPLWRSPQDPVWRTVTHIWLVHRAIARVAVSSIAVGVPVYMLAHVSTSTAQTSWAVTASVAAVAIAPLIGSSRYALRPPVILGQVVELEDGPSIVVAISLEGVRLRGILEPPPNDQFQFGPSDHIVPLDQVGGYPISAPAPARAFSASAWYEPSRESGRQASDRRVVVLMGGGLSWVRSAVVTAVSLATVAAASAEFVGMIVSLPLQMAAVAGAGLAGAGLVTAVLRLRRDALVERVGQSARLDPPLAYLAEAVPQQHDQVRRRLGPDTSRGWK